MIIYKQELTWVYHNAAPKSERDRFMTLSPHSIRHGREVGSMMLVFVIALAYASSSPLILVFALAYFFASWVMWRHHLLYIYERCYESGGRMWDKIFDYMMWCLFLLEFFTGMASHMQRQAVPMQYLTVLKQYCTHMHPLARLFIYALLQVQSETF